MSVPKRRQTSTRGAKRRSHDGIKKFNAVKQDGPATGMYKTKTPLTEKKWYQEA